MTVSVSMFQSHFLGVLFLVIDMGGEVLDLDTFLVYTLVILVNLGWYPS